MTMILIASLLIACIEEEQEEEEEEVSEFAEIGPMVGMILAHNIIRQEHGIEIDLVWDEELTEISKEWIEHLELDNNCQMEHNWDSPLGENLFWANYMTTATEVVNSWASEEEFYDYDSNSCEPGEMCGHYTQIVWEDTTRVGCAMLECSISNEFLWMCNYDPAGNWVGEKPY
jgi:pathogenesis-related protein 1